MNTAKIYYRNSLIHFSTLKTNNPLHSLILYIHIEYFFSCRNDEGQKKTGYKSKTLNPVFNEIFSFQLPQSCIADTKLRVAIWDHDFFGEDDFNGEGIVDLSRIHLSSGTHTDWFMLQLEVQYIHPEI